MNALSNKNRIHTIKQGDPRFMITNGLVIAPRAGFEISHNCPDRYQKIIAQCINHGWIKPVASLTERELIFNGLSNE